MTFIDHLRRLAATAVLLAALSGLAAPSAWADSQTPDEVLAQCRVELQAGQPVELRRRATLVVGKYLTPQASALLAQCLNDSDAMVRRNALVSIGEEQFHLHQNHLGVINALADAEVNIRRLASSLLDEVLSGPIAFAQPPAGPPDAPSRPRPAAVPLELVVERLNQALADEDAAVRGNVLTALQSARLPVSGKALQPFLESADSATVILAIEPYLRSDATAAERLDTLGKLARSAAPEIRSALAEALADEPSPELLPLYRQLAGDALPEIRANALALLLTFAPGDAKALQDVKQLLVDEQGSAETRARLLEQLRSLQPDDLWTLLEPMLDIRQGATLRRQAWQLLLLTRPLQARLDFQKLLDSFAVETLPDIRRLQLSMLRARQGELTAAGLAALQKSDTPDVRKAALALSTKLGAPERAELILEALLDEDESNRLEAVRLLASVRPPDWIQLLCDSLDEPSPAIAAAAARGLLTVAKNDDAVRSALRKYLPRCSDAMLRRRLAELLQ